MEFSQDKTNMPRCASNREDQELAVLKYLRVVYTDIILDLVKRKVALNKVVDNDNMLCL